MEAKQYILLLYFIANVSSFAYVSPINVQQKMEILERKSQLQALEIQLLQQELTDLREVNRTLQNSLTNTDSTSAATVDPPQDTMFSIEERINSLVNLFEQKNRDNLKMFAEMKSGLSSVNDIQAKLQDQLQNLTTGLMESKCIRTQEGIHKSENNCMIAFHATLTRNIANLQPWQTIVFDNVRTNHGNAYSGTNGTFTAPRSGMFVFYVHIIGSNRPMEVCLKKNNDCIALLYSQGSSTGYYGSDDNMAVVDLAEGERVYTVKSDVHGSAPFYVYRGWSNFAGYMLYPL